MTIFNHIKANKVNLVTSQIFESIPVEIQEILAKMTCHDPERRLSAKQLIIKLSKLTKIWKTQVRQNFFRAGRRKNNSFSVTLLSNPNLESIPIGTQTNAENPFLNRSWEKGQHVPIGQVFSPKGAFAKKLVIKERAFGSPEKKVKKEKKKFGNLLTLSTNIINDCRLRRSQMLNSPSFKRSSHFLNFSKDFFN